MFGPRLNDSAYQYTVRITGQSDLWATLYEIPLNGGVDPSYWKKQAILASMLFNTFQTPLQGHPGGISRMFLAGLALGTENLESTDFQRNYFNMHAGTPHPVKILNFAQTLSPGYLASSFDAFQECADDLGKGSLGPEMISPVDRGDVLKRFLVAIHPRRMQNYVYMTMRVDMNVTKGFVEHRHIVASLIVKFNHFLNAASGGAPAPPRRMSLLMHKIALNMVKMQTGTDVKELRIQPLESMLRILKGKRLAPLTAEAGTVIVLQGPQLAALKSYPAEADLIIGVPIGKCVNCAIGDALPHNSCEHCDQPILCDECNGDSAVVHHKIHECI